MGSFQRFGPTLLAFCVVAAGARAWPAEKTPADLPKASVDFDGQTLRLAYAASNDVMTLMEFIPDGQTLDDWTSLAAVHLYSTAAIGPQKRADALAAQVGRSNPKAPIAFHDSPNSSQRLVSFAAWTDDESFVEFNIFAFGSDESGRDVGLQYAIRQKTSPEAFLQRDLEPLRERLVKTLLREGLQVAHETDLTPIRRGLSQADRAICDTLLKDESQGLEAVLRQPEERPPLVLFLASAIAFNGDRLEDAAFLFYCGQLRLRFDERCFPPRSGKGENPVASIREYSLQLGAKINPAVMNEPRVFSTVLARVARWRPRVPAAYRPGYDFDRRLTEEEARAAAEPNRAEFLSRMGDVSTLLDDEHYLLATRLVRSLCVPGEDRLPTKEEYEAAIKTMSRIEREKGIGGFTRN